MCILRSAIELIVRSFARYEWIRLAPPSDSSPDGPCASDSEARKEMYTDRAGSVSSLSRSSVCSARDGARTVTVASSPSPSSVPFPRSSTASRQNPRTPWGYLPMQASTRPKTSSRQSGLSSRSTLRGSVMAASSPEALPVHSPN